MGAFGYCWLEVQEIWPFTADLPAQGSAVTALKILQLSDISNPIHKLAHVTCN
jgi:hypothetical protein